MTRASFLPALVAACLLAGCTKSKPETGAMPVQDSTMAGGSMAKDSAMMAKDSAMMGSDSAKMMMDSTQKMMPDSSSMHSDSTMKMPADSAR